MSGYDTGFNPTNYGSGDATFGNGTYGDGTPTDNAASQSGGGTNYLDYLKFAANMIAANKKGRFVNVPQTPEQRAAYHAALTRMNNLPDANAAAFPLAFVGASSAPALDMDKLRAGQSGAYKAPYAMTTNDLTDILQKNKADNAALATSTAKGTNPNAVPPPPPYTPKTGAATKTSEYDSMLKGAGSGLAFGPVGALGGAIVGGISGILHHRGARHNYQQQSDQAYQAWANQYGDSFTDAQGNKVAVPKNFDEYKKWYQLRYGKPFAGEQQTPDQIAAQPQPHVNIADTVLDWWKQNHYGQPQGGG